MKKILSLLLVLVMLLGMMAMTAFATEKDPGRLSLEGLNVLCLGDSITAGQGLTTETRWTNVLASKYGWNLTNKSQGGISLSSYYYTANGKTDVSIAKKAEILKTMDTKPDVIIVWGGHNDTSYRYSPLGTWDDETTDSFKGALKYIAELADEYAPDATLFVLTPLWVNENPSTLKVPESTTDTNWMFVDAIYDGAEAYGWIPINMDLCGITPFTKSGLLLDNIHPNEAGTEKIVEYLSEKLASYGANSKKETIIFNASAVSMKPGESTTLKAVLSPRSGTGTMTFTWSSSDSSVAMVDTSGKITAVAPGTAVVTATVPNGTSADVTVSVACNHTYENGICTGCGEKLSFEGKTISILGDSISTFADISDDSTVNATLSGSTVYYGQGSLGGYRHTWWQQVIDTLGMELLVNNSWSGTCVLKTRGTVGAYIDRCVQLHNDRTGEQPDVIAVFMGTNDYSYYQSTLGTAEIDYAALITDRGDGTFDYAKPTTTCEAYAIMLHKMTQRYPDAEIYCLGMLSRRDPDHDGREVVPPPTSFNAELKAIVERFGGTYVDVESVIPATASEFDRYMSDRRVHPNAAGMDKITEAVVGTMLQRQVTLRNVSYDLHNVSCSKEPAAVIENEPFELTFTATDNGLDLAVRVTMGGEDITSECYANGKVSIAKITGDIVITAMVLHGPSDYQWQFDNGELVSAGTNANQLTKLAGSTQDNVFRDTRYQLAVTAELIHTRPWVVEWDGEGKGGFMLSQTSNSTDAPFFFRRSGNYLTAFGHYNNNRYDNYGLTLDAANINGAARHVYRLENRIAQNGNNMVWLLVDGIEIGALNNYYIAGASQGSTADWISGKDFHINYIGSSSHPLSGYALEYLSITECAHIFSNGTCTGCGETCESVGHVYKDEFDAFCDGCNAIREINYPADKVELREIDGVKYICVNGRTSVEGLFKVGDDYYCATWGGVVLTGDQYVHFSYCDKAAGRHFYFSEDGKMLDKGFVTGEDGIKRLYVDSRTSVEGLFEVDGKYYLATWGGVVLTDGRYYISESFVEDIDGGRNFTVGADGTVLDGIVEINGQKYLYDFGTTVFPGIYEIDGIEYTVTWGGLIEE